ncbi:MAG: GFA family protein [Pseudomonadales bacterium]|nr:GFA family protein [Pseudomonadales bacterium]
MVSGQCNCGEVQYSVDAETSGVIRCHCSICRRASGANGIAIVVAPADRFVWVSGQNSVTSWQKPDSDWKTGFCNVCGSPAPGENDAMNAMFIPAGSLTEGADELNVDQHIWVDSKASWDVIGDQGMQHPEGFPAS